MLTDVRISNDPSLAMYQALTCEGWERSPVILRTALGGGYLTPVLQTEKLRHRESRGKWQSDSGLHRPFLSPFHPDLGNRQHILILTHGVIKTTSGVIGSHGCAFSQSLYNNQITDVGARYIARILDACKGLTHLK